MLHTSGYFWVATLRLVGIHRGFLRLVLPYGEPGGHSRSLARQTCVTAVGFGFRIFLPSRMSPEAPAEGPTPPGPGPRGVPLGVVRRGGASPLTEVPSGCTQGSAWRKDTAVRHAGMV